MGKLRCAVGATFLFGGIAQAHPLIVATNGDVVDDDSGLPVESINTDARPTEETPRAAVVAAPLAVAAASTVLDAVMIDQLVDARLAARAQNAGWNGSFYVQTADGKTRLQIGGVTQFDARFFVASGNDPSVDQFGFRAIRPDLRGTILEHYDYRLMTDFAGGKLVLQDVYADVNYSDKLKVRFGKFKVPFGLERLQADTTTTFVERGMPSQLTPNRDVGVQVFGVLADGLLEYEAGIFNGVADGASGDGDVSNSKEGAARVFIKPFVHGSAHVKQFGFGAAATYGNMYGTYAEPDVPTFKTQGQTTFFAYKVGTSAMDTVIADGLHWRATAQTGWYDGPVGAFAEYVRSVQNVALGNAHERVVADASQAVVQWVLTGEDASYGGVTPSRPLDPQKGQWGAFDIAARVGELQVVDGSLFEAGFADPTKSARRARSAGVGADWFANRNFRFVVDFERTWFEYMATTHVGENSLVGRFQTVF